VNKSAVQILFFIVCGILSINAIRSINNSYSVASVYVERKLQTERQYVELVKKKNELDYINSAFFVEKQLRESLNYYRRGEKLLVFTSPVSTGDNTIAQREDVRPLLLWKEVLFDGIKDPF
jgi:hypothetical protein